MPSRESPTETPTPLLHLSSSLDVLLTATPGNGCLVRLFSDAPCHPPSPNSRAANFHAKSWSIRPPSSDGSSQITTNQPPPPPSTPKLPSALVSDPRNPQGLHSAQEILSFPNVRPDTSRSRSTPREPSTHTLAPSPGRHARSQRLGHVRRSEEEANCLGNRERAPRRREDWSRWPSFQTGKRLCRLGGSDNGERQYGSRQRL
jgi:hypothetical protein